MARRLLLALTMEMLHCWIADEVDLTFSDPAAK